MRLEKPRRERMAGQERFLVEGFHKIGKAKMMKSSSLSAHPDQLNPTHHISDIDKIPQNLA